MLTAQGHGWGPCLGVRLLSPWAPFTPCICSPGEIPEEPRPARASTLAADLAAGSRVCSMRLTAPHEEGMLSASAGFSRAIWFLPLSGKVLFFVLLLLSPHRRFWNLSLQSDCKVQLINQQSPNSLRNAGQLWSRQLQEQSGRRTGNLFLPPSTEPFLSPSPPPLLSHSLLSSPSSHLSPQLSSPSPSARELVSRLWL